ncbi:MAG: copper amine oxidase N-terminal domain-containing protein [Defluviitaleaceae bacterium]|nr:copper amine oxidase N-terminal domain-containing protein [Defluviitaleaceae bacterium]
MLGYTDAHDFQGINQWPYGRIYDIGLHHDMELNSGDWIQYMFRELELNAEENTLNWLNVTGVESFRVYAFSNADETDTANAVASASIQRGPHDIYQGTPGWRDAEVSFDLGQLAIPAGTHYVRVQSVAQEVPVRGQDGLLWGVNSPLSLPVQVEGQGEAEATAEPEAEATVEPVQQPAEEGSRHFTMTLGSTEIVDAATGATTQMDVVPVVEEGRTLVPVRFVAQALGGSASWNEATSEVTITIGSETLTFAIGEVVEGMDIPAQLIDNRTMVPLNFIAEHFGAEVSFDDTTRIIEVIK